MPYPLLPRTLVGALGVLVLLHGLQSALVFDADGLEASAVAQVAVSGAFAGFLVLLAVAPWEVESLAPARSPLDLRRSGHYGALVAAAGALTVVLGLAGVVETVHLLESDAAFAPQSEAQVIVGLAFNALVLLGAPLVWVLALHPGVPPWRALGLLREGAVRASLVGVAAALVALFALAAVVALLVTVLGVEIPVNERALEIGRALSPAGALVVALASGLTEEVFFRGWLQPRIGLLGQTAAFTVAHFNYVNVGETVAVAVLGLAFGLLYRGTRNLWAPVFAHAAFNFVMFVAASAA